MLAHIIPLLARSHGWNWLHFNVSFGAQPIIALVAGLLILLRPKLLNFVVAAYLILIGVIGILHLHW